MILQPRWELAWLLGKDFSVHEALTNSYIRQNLAFLHLCLAAVSIFFPRASELHSYLNTICRSGLRCES